MARVDKSDKVEAAGCVGHAMGKAQASVPEFGWVCQIWLVGWAAIGVPLGAFAGFALSLAMVSFIENGVEPKPISDRHLERRIAEQAEDGLFIMRPAFLVALGFGASARAGMFQRCAFVRRSRGMARAM